MDNFLKLIFILLLSIVASCSHDSYIIVTNQKLRSLKYDYPKGLTIEGFEHEYNQEIWEYERGERITGFFCSDTLKEYFSFHFWRKLNSISKERCGCQNKKIVNPYTREFFKTHKYNRIIKDSLMEDINYQGSNTIKQRIISKKNQKIDTFYMGEIYFPVSSQSQYYFVHKKKCYVIRKKHNLIAKRKFPERDE